MMTHMTSWRNHKEPSQKPERHPWSRSRPAVRRGSVPPRGSEYRRNQKRAHRSLPRRGFHLKRVYTRFYSRGLWKHATEESITGKQSNHMHVYMYTIDGRSNKKRQGGPRSIVLHSLTLCVMHWFHMSAPIQKYCSVCRVFGDRKGGTPENGLLKTRRGTETGKPEKLETVVNHLLKICNIG